ncbi:MAG: hypothetical protein ACI8R8_002628, partial [Paraglaciecola sp.]
HSCDDQTRTTALQTMPVGMLPSWRGVSSGILNDCDMTVCEPH